jgi:hypothetical protein
MHDDLLIIFSNYNGNRETLNLKIPRYKVVLDSFISTVPYYKKLNVLLLDNNSNDGSEKIITEYIEKVNSPSWHALYKKSEDFYLGTLYKLVEKFGNKYKYFMVVDNDHFFYQKRDFLSEALEFIENRDTCNVLHLKNVTPIDIFDHYHMKLSWFDRLRKKQPKAVVAVFDKIFSNKKNTVLLRSLPIERAKETEYCQSVNPKRGSVIFKFKDYLSKRLCWTYYGFSNLIIRTSMLKKVFEDARLSLPYKSNSDRLAIFASKVGELGESWFFQHGASINFGWRKSALKKNANINLVKIIDEYKNREQESLYTKNGYSFFVKEKKVHSDIESFVRKAINS